MTQPPPKARARRVSARPGRPPVLENAPIARPPEPAPEQTPRAASSAAGTTEPPPARAAQAALAPAVASSDPTVAMPCADFDADFEDNDDRTILSPSLFDAPPAAGGSDTVIMSMPMHAPPPTSDTVIAELPEVTAAAVAAARADQRWMERALTEAERAAALGDVPVGAVVVQGEQCIAAAHNRRQLDQDPTAHAEILALRAAAKQVGSWHLEKCTLYVTLEPCVMCAGALVLARIGRVVYGAADPKAGALDSLFALAGDPRLNHRYPVTAGVLAQRCGAVLSDFFREVRARRRETRA